MVFYRKYRPQTIEELDSKDIRERLSNALKSPDISHAFLFTGPKGLGKTSTARIVAKSLNCEGKNQESRIKNQEKVKSKDKTHDSSFIIHDSKSVEPCNKCSQCKSITNGTNMDILEIDAASNRGIDEIRDLREKVKLSPMAARKKVYIIDEVHMLTTEAFNALLKTLEEPPNHVVFILCTTESHKVPETILSRCLRIQFKKATVEELIRSFERIIKSEKLEAEPDALRLIAGLSDGSFRDGVKILEEMVSITKSKKITKELVEKSYSIASMQYKIAQIIKSLEEKDAKGGLEVVAKLTSEGIEMGNFMQGLIEVLHNSLLSKAGVETTSAQGLTMDNLKLEMGEIKKLIKLLSEAKSELKYAVLPQLPLELVVVEWGMQTKISTDLNTDGRGSGVQRESVVKSVPIVNTAVIKEGIAIDKPSVVVVQQDISKYSEHDALRTAFIDKVKTHNHSVAGVLRGCNIKSYDGKTLLLETNFKFHKEKLSEIKTREILSNSLKEVTKKDVRIEIELKGK